MHSIINKAVSAISGVVLFAAAAVMAGLGLAVIGALGLFALAAIGVALLAAPFVAYAQSTRNEPSKEADPVDLNAEAVA